MASAFKLASRQHVEYASLPTFIIEESFETRLRHAISIAWKVFARKVGGGLIPINKEASMQLQYAYLLKQLLPLILHNSDESADIELETRVRLATGASETKLRKLLEHYGFSLKHIINLLGPQTPARGQSAEKPAGTRKPRELKVYKNPNTGEVIETKGGNHKALKEWKAEHGADVVEGWLKK